MPLDFVGLDLPGNPAQIVEVVHLVDIIIPVGEGADIELGGNLVQGVLGVYPILPPGNERLHLPSPSAEGLAAKLIQGLKGAAIRRENRNGNLLDPFPGEAGLKILLRQGTVAIHAAQVGAGIPEQRFHQILAEDQVAVEKQDIVVEVLPSQIHGIDVVGGLVGWVLHEGEAQAREIRRGGGLLQSLLQRAGGNEESADAAIAQQAQLPGEDGVAVEQSGHGFMVGEGKIPHAVAQAGVIDDRFQAQSPLLRISIRHSGAKGKRLRAAEIFVLNRKESGFTEEEQTRSGKARQRVNAPGSERSGLHKYRNDVPVRKRLVAPRRRYGRVYKAIAAASVTFCGGGASM